MLFFTTVLLGVGQGRKLLNLGLWPELSPKDELLKKQSEMIIPVNDCGRLFFMTCHTEIECCQSYELPALRALMAPNGPEMPQPALKHSVGTWWQPWCRTCTAAPLMPDCCSCQGSADVFWMSSPPCLGLLIVPNGTTTAVGEALTLQPVSSSPMGLYVSPHAAIVSAIPAANVAFDLHICIPLTKAHEREDSKGTLPLVTDSISLQMQKQRFEVCLDCCAAPLPLGLGVNESGHLTWEMELLSRVQDLFVFIACEQQDLSFHIQCFGFDVKIIRSQDLPVSHVCLASCELHRLQQTLSQRTADLQQQQNTQYFSTVLCDWEEERGRSYG
ncbi:hypothetical protein Anapl_03954 [Anas platyrhynchos]|uniref:Uncharacterized protein n=1 Tax=Anas platyrhynchos TaxID=8839 RepID=R0KFU1_ANAPL|nr:hypothetical protein Anapl_03954 [Anas platyrhynchos]